MDDVSYILYGVKLTGHKIIADTYGEYVRHGGGAFSEMDCIKVDRIAAILQDTLPKTLLLWGFAEKCEIWLSDQ